MGQHTVEGAKKQLSKLIDDAIQESVSSSSVTAAPASNCGLSWFPYWLAAHRVGKVEPTEDAGMLVSGIRDEDGP
jgi:hypothetical protein